MLSIESLTTPLVLPAQGAQVGVHGVVDAGRSTSQLELPDNPFDLGGEKLEAGTLEELARLKVQCGEDKVCSVLVQC